MKAEPKGKKLTKADEPIGIFEKAKEPAPRLRPLGEVPPVRSGPSSSSAGPAPPDGEEERPEPQDVEPKSEVKEEEKVPEKKEPSPSANLPLTCTSENSWEIRITNWTSEITSETLSHVDRSVQT